MHARKNVVERRNRETRETRPVLIFVSRAFHSTGWEKRKIAHSLFKTIINSLFFFLLTSLCAILTIWTPGTGYLGPVYMGESYPGERITLPVQSTFTSGYMRKKLTYLPEQDLTTAIAHALVVSPWSSWPGWVSRSVYMDNVCSSRSLYVCGKLLI